MLFVVTVFWASVLAVVLCWTNVLGLIEIPIMHTRVRLSRAIYLFVPRWVTVVINLISLI
jgi:hypothetical protein